MFGIGCDAFNASCLQFVRVGLVPLVLGALCATPLPWKLFSSLQERQPLVCSIALIVVFLLCIAFLVFDSYNPFLYFRF